MSKAERIKEIFMNNGWHVQTRFNALAYTVFPSNPISVAFPSEHIYNADLKVKDGAIKAVKLYKQTITEQCDKLIKELKDEA